VNSIPRYKEVKDSGIEWLGKVPHHWKVQPARLAFRPKLVKNLGLKEKQVLSLSYGRILVKPEEKLRGLVPESFETYQIVDPGDIVVRTTDLQNDQTSLRIGYSGHRGIITSAYLNLNTTSEVTSEFGYQILNAYDLLKIIYGYGSGLRQNLDFSDIKRMPVPVPPLDEQRAIVRFLDHVDRRIRLYVRAKQKLIRLLEEQKQAIIHRAVTRGLDPNVRLKPSGVEWLGEVPEHWEVKRGKFVFESVDVRSTTGSEELLTVSSRDGVVPRAGRDITMFMASSYVGHKLCWPEDLVINSLWAWANGLGFSPHHGIVSTAYGVYRLKKPYRALWQYLNLALRSGAYGWQFHVRSKGIWKSRLQLTDWSFLDMPVVLPPQEEVASICQKVENETAELGSAMKFAGREIELLRECRTRLIADVVTGKLDVREAAAGLPDEERGIETSEESVAEEAEGEGAYEEEDEDELLEVAEGHE